MLTTAAIIVGAYLLICFVLFAAQKNLLYHPTPNVQPTVGERAYFSVNDQHLSAVVLNKAEKSALVYFGGNAEQAETSAFEFGGNLEGVAVYLVNYRGYGGSSGQPSEKGILADALAVYDEISAEHDPVVVMGRSLGSGVATYVASERSIRKIILVTPYDSIKNVASDAFPIFPTGWLVTEKFESKRFAVNVDADVLVLFAGHDEVIGNKRTESLLEALDLSRTQIERISQANHNDISMHPAYWPAIRNFLR